MPAATGAPVDELRVRDACADDNTKCTAEEKRKLEILTHCIERPDLCDSKKSRLTAYQPNYAILQNTNDDERSIEVHYSFKYSFTKPHCMPLKKSKGSDAYPDIDCLNDYDSRWEAFFTYTGEFDFYMGTRDSSPVVNRISNPAFHYRKHLGDTFSGKAMSLEWLNVAIEHRSDGQVIEADEKITDPASPDFGRYRAQVELEKGNHQYFDAISRGANYFSFEGKLNIGKSHSEYKVCNEELSCVSTWVSAKLYFTKDSDVYWGPQANRGITISDYDRFRFVIADAFNTSFSPIPKMELGLEWTVGDELLSTDSFDINVFFPWIPKDNLKIPLYLRAHIGPMNTLSDYTKEQNSIGIGVRFR